MTTKIKQLLNDEGAVSPVIGVILMVAITVILAAVIGTFVLGLGGQVSQTAPQASISVQNIDTTAEQFQLKHGGSDPIVFEETDIKVSVAGSSIGTYSASTGSSNEFTTADTLYIDLESANDAAGVKLNSDGGTTEYTGSFTTDLADGQSYTITFVDQPSGQIITEKTGTI